MKSIIIAIVVACVVQDCTANRVVDLCMRNQGFEHRGVHYTCNFDRVDPIPEKKQ